MKARAERSARAALLLAAAGLLACGAAPTRNEARSSLPVARDLRARDGAPPSPTPPSASASAPTDLPDGLDERVDVPGTGVSMRAPNGATRTPIGAGFVDDRGGFQIFVAIANDDDDVLETFDELGADGVEIESEDVWVDGRATRLVTDSRYEDGVDLERVWIILREGRRALAVLCEYGSGDSARLRTVARSSMRSIRWDATATLEPERAAGFRLAPPPGLAADPQILNGITYREAGTRISPASGRPALLLFPLPIQVPAEERARHCAWILATVGPIPEDGVTSGGDIATGTLQGCEVFGREPVLDPVEGGPTELATYAAIVFLDEAPFMVAGFVDAEQSETWTPLFRDAVRTIARAAR